MRPRILYLTTHNPFGESYGAQLRAFHIGRALSQAGKVTLVLAGDGELPPGYADRVKDVFEEVRSLRLSVIPRRLLEVIRRNTSLQIGRSFGITCSQ